MVAVFASTPWWWCAVPVPASAAWPHDHAGLLQPLGCALGLGLGLGLAIGFGVALLCGWAFLSAPSKLTERLPRPPPLLPTYARGAVVLLWRKLTSAYRITFLTICIAYMYYSYVIR